MKRDFDLIRNIMAYIYYKCECEVCCSCSELEKVRLSLHDTAISERPFHIAKYHIHMLKQSGYIDIGYLDMVETDIRHRSTQLTWKGHEFFSLIQNPESWKYIKDTISSANFFISVTTIEKLAKKYIALTLDY